MEILFKTTCCLALTRHVLDFFPTPLLYPTLHLGPPTTVLMTTEDKCVSRGKLWSRNGGKKFPKCGVYLDILERQRGEMRRNLFLAPYYYSHRATRLWDPEGSPSPLPPFHFFIAARTRDPQRESSSISSSRNSLSFAFFTSLARVLPEEIGICCVCDPAVRM